MATREQIVEKLASRRVRNFYLPGLTRLQVRQAAQQLTDEDWDEIITAIRTNANDVIGAQISGRTLVYLKGLAVADVESALSPDDTLSITELENLF